jgi:hypothetical protein
MVETIPMQDTTAQYPLPPRTDDLVLGTPEMFTHLEEYEYEGIPGFEEISEMCSLDIRDLTNGALGSHAFRMKPEGEGQRQPSPWHFHHVEMHLSILLTGWVRLELEGVGEKLIEPGKLYLQPARIRHRELEMPAGTTGFEITMPARYKTTFYLFDEETKSYKEQDLWL